LAQTAEQEEKPFIKDIRVEEDEDNNERDSNDLKPIKQVLSNRRRMQKAGLLPPEFYKNPTTIAGEEKVNEEISELKFKDPLSKKTKRRLEQVSQDYVVSSALATLIYYVLGRGMKATIYPVTREQLKTQEEVDAKLNDVIKEFSLGPESMKEFQDFIDMVDLNCGLYEQHLAEAMAQAYIFGRAALWIVRANSTIEQEEQLVKWGFKEGVPVALRPLDSSNLGQVTVDTKSWEPKRIAYEGNLGESDAFTGRRHEMEEINTSELIYFTRDDYNIIPDSYNYGQTRLLDAIAVSENKRRLTKKVLAEINNNQWAGLNVYEIAGMSAKDMQAFADTLKPARNKITNQPVKVHNINPQFDMNGNLEQLKQLTLELLMAMKVPSFLMNFESVTNRATAQGVAHIWQQTVLEAERNWLRNILWKYWYKPLMQLFFPDTSFLYMKIKVLLEFQSIEFSSLFEKSIAVNNLLAARIISIREAREMLQMPPFPPDQEGMAEEQMAMTEELIRNNPDLLARMEAQKAAEGQQQPAGPETAGRATFKKPTIAQTPGTIKAITGKSTPEQILARQKRKASSQL
jgi:hypothetical protein